MTLDFSEVTVGIEINIYFEFSTQLKKYTAVTNKTVFNFSPML